MAKIGENIPTRRDEVWKTIAIISLSANVTGVSAWMVFALDKVTKTEMQAAIANAPYPWPYKEGAVMGHIENESIHETDGKKRRRIREEMEPFREDLREIKADLKEIKDGI